MFFQFIFCFDHDFFHQVNESFEVLLGQRLLLHWLGDLALTCRYGYHAVLDLAIQSGKEGTIVACNDVVSVSPIEIQRIRENFWNVVQVMSTVSDLWHRLLLQIHFHLGHCRGIPLLLQTELLQVCSSRRHLALGSPCLLKLLAAVCFVFG